jgi:hypothetical protein
MCYWASFIERRLIRDFWRATDVRLSLHLVKRERGRKTIRDAKGKYYDLDELFQSLNFQYFNGLMSAPQLGWSLKPSQTTLGHYDPGHHTIVLSCLLDSGQAPRLIVEFVMFHEMLHLRYPTEHRGARRCVHTPRFKAAERAFERFAEAKKELKNFLERLSRIPV